MYKASLMVLSRTFSQKVVVKENWTRKCDRPDLTNRPDREEHARKIYDMLLPSGSISETAWLLSSAVRLASPASLFGSGGCAANLPFPSCGRRNIRGKPH